MNYITVFDASNAPFRHWWFVAPGLVFVALGAAMVFRHEAIQRLGIKGAIRWPAFRWFFFLFAMLWTITSAIAVFGGGIAARRQIKYGNCIIVEGKVEQFHPMPADGHDTERFTVAGVSFAYSDYILTAGFNNTASHGGPIREGLPVRICYRGKDILKLEIAR